MKQQINTNTKNKSIEKKEENVSCHIRVHPATHLQQFSVPKNSTVEIKFEYALTFFQQEVTQAECVCVCVCVSSENPLFFHRSVN